MPKPGNLRFQNHLIDRQVLTLFQRAQSWFLRSRFVRAKCCADYACSSLSAILCTLCLLTSADRMATSVSGWTTFSWNPITALFLARNGLFISPHLVWKNRPRFSKRIRLTSNLPTVIVKQSKELAVDTSLWKQRWAFACTSRNTLHDILSLDSQAWNAYFIFLATCWHLQCKPMQPLRL